MSTPDAELFESQVRDCLAHLYDYAFLREHPLVHQLVLDVPGDASRVQAFRQLISEAIDRLKPEPDANIDSAQARTYRILTLRYLKQQPTQHVLRQLNLSERQFYRDHMKAIQILRQMLWEQITATKPPVSTTAISIQSEIARIHNQVDTQPVAAKAFLEKAVAALHSLADRQGVEVCLQNAEGVLSGGIDHTLLRQTVIWILSQLLIHAPGHNRVMLSYRPEGARCRFIFEITDASSFSVTHLPLDAQETLQSFLTILDGNVFEETYANGRSQIVLELPLKPHFLLIIDDNPDAITLFQRYLTGQPYKLLAAYDATQAVTQACESQPELIILDVMLPHQDGWETLQSLKNHPQTRHIPVLICSVLNIPDLARSLGADGFLRKPPGEHDFLVALAQFIGIQAQPG
ncbi:MAG: response regulator [Aggregatilineales bacterium]